MSGSPANFHVIGTRLTAIQEFYRVRPESVTYVSGRSSPAFFVHDCCDALRCVSLCDDAMARSDVPKGQQGFDGS